MKIRIRLIGISAAAAEDCCQRSPLAEHATASQKPMNAKGSLFIKSCMTMFVLLCSAVFLLGCQLSKPHIVPNDPNYAPVSPQQLVAPPLNNGSLYREGFGVSLYDDNTARRVGDILTVQLTEKMNSDSTSESSASRDTDLDVANPTLLGGSISGVRAPGMLPIRDFGDSGVVSVDSTNAYSGKGSSTESHELKDGFITVTVSNVYPNGNLEIRGEKWISLNEDEKYIRLTGIVRPEDVSGANIVQSTKIANARITYGGKGLVSENSAPGWIARFFLSPLWPF